MFALCQPPKKLSPAEVSRVAILEKCHQVGGHQTLSLHMHLALYMHPFLILTLNNGGFVKPALEQ